MVFHVLDRENLIKIVDLEIDTVVKRLAGKNIHLQLDKEAKEFLIEQGFDPNYGARPMRRAVERHIEDPLAEHLLRGDVAPGHVVKITHKKDEKYLSFRPVGVDESETDEAVEPANTVEG